MMHNGNTYPPVQVTNIFEHLREGMEVGPSDIVGANEGLHVKGAFKKDQIIGVYEGIVVAETEGDYILEIGDDKRKTIRVDADPNVTARMSIFGKMNENFDGERYNAELGEDGFVRLLRDCSNEELFTKYGPKYKWDSLKTKALHNLVDEVEKRFPTMKYRISRCWTKKYWSLTAASRCGLGNWLRVGA